jgi:hypothetical protein
MSLTSTNSPPKEAKVIEFPTADILQLKRLDEIDWDKSQEWDMELGKPHGVVGDNGYRDINGEIDTAPNLSAIARMETNDLARYKDASPAAITLAKAISLIDGDRDKQHGDRHENFGMIAALWSTYLGKEIKPHQVAWCMVLMKAARESNGTHSLDNAIDAAGYAALAGELAQ